MSSEKDNWFIEHFDSAGTAFGLRLKRKLESVQTDYQHIEMWDTDTFGYLMTIDGATMLTTRDNFLYHEMMAHPALFSHAAPRNVLIIGGGDCGTLREVLRHGEVASAVQIDIDEQVTRFSEKYFPELCESNSDERAELRFEDGVKFMQECEAGRFDVIIVDSTDPVGPAEGLFKAEFFRHCHRALADGGVLVEAGGRVTCTLCGVTLPSSSKKAAKQHLKSKPHKAAVKAAAMASARGEIPPPHSPI